MIRALQRLPVDTWSQTYLPTVVRIPHGRSVPDVIAAFEALSGRHDSLRSYFTDVAVEPESRTVSAGALDIEFVELPGCDESAARSVAAALSAPRFDWTTQFAWRATVVTDSGLPVYAVVVVDHLVADRWGLRRLSAELRSLLGESDEDGRRWLAETPPQPHELAALQRSDAWHARRQAVHRYWDRLLHDQASNSFPWPETRDDNGRIEAIMRSSRARFALGRAAHRLGTSPQSVLLALTAVAAATAFDLDRVVLTLQAGNRFERRWRGIVSSMNQAAPLPVAIPPESVGFAEFAAQVQSASLSAYRHGAYNVDAIRAKVLDARSVPLNFDCHFNFMAHDVAPHDTAPPVDLAPTEVSLTSPRRQAGPRFDVKVRGGADMPLVVRADPALLDENRLRLLLFWFGDELQRLSTENRVPVSAVRDRCAFD